MKYLVLPYWNGDPESKWAGWDGEEFDTDYEAEDFRKYQEEIYEHNFYIEEIEE